MLTPWKESYDQRRQHIQKQRHYLANKCPSSHGCGFSSSHVWMWELDYTESLALKNWCFSTVMLKKTLESPLDCKEIKSVNSKGNQAWSYTERTNGDSTHWKRPWCLERLRVGGEGGKRAWDGWMASPTQWTGVWTNSGRSWRTQKRGILQSMDCKESDVT